jgi:hypothetical protein
MKNAIFFTIEKSADSTTTMYMDEIKQKNQKKFEAIKKLDLPLGQYAIISSGPLGIRDLRAIGDIDIIVTPELWDVFAKKYGVIDQDGVKKVTLLEGDVEAFCEDSFYTEQKADDAPTVAERIATAEIIEGLPFERLEYVLYYKRKMRRDKDLSDIAMIEAWLYRTFSE